jgi:hypothetical protein
MTRPRRSTRITRLHSYHGTVRPCAPHRYSPPRGFSRSRFSLQATSRRPHHAPLASHPIGTTGSHVPHQCPGQARATFMPDAAWPIDRHPPDSSRDRFSTPVSASSRSFRHVIEWFALARLLDPHLTRSRRAFSRDAQHERLLTDAPRGRFAASPCRATAEDHQPKRPAPPSLDAAPHRLDRSSTSLLRRVRGRTKPLDFSLRGRRPRACVNQPDAQNGTRTQQL